jgi:Protein of unknown function (DUF2569)/GYF domain 2
MSNVWYYAEGETSRGPMTLEELASVLSLVSQPNTVLVWRPGFESWQRAEDVKEVAASLFKPPLKVEALRKPLQRISAATPHAYNTALAKPKPISDPNLNGIGGWLVLMALGQIFGPLRFFVSVGQYYSSLDSSLFQKFPVAFVGEALMNVALAVLYVYTAILFFRTSRRFPRFFVYEVFAAVFSMPLSAVWVAVTIGMVTGQPVGHLFQSAFEPREVGQAIAAAIVGSIWILYLFKSKRVANTFTL